MKVKLNPAFEGMSGKLGEMVFREVRGRTVVSRKPALNGSEPTPGQTDHRERFKQAVAYGKSVMADPETRLLYEAAAKNKDMPVFALTVADFFNAPVIHEVDLTEYHGQMGNQIKIITGDDIGVIQVGVHITDLQNTPLEEGNAVETSPGSGHWIFTTTTNVSPLPSVNIRVVATDRPGGTAVKTVTKSV